MYSVFEGQLRLIQLSLMMDFVAGNHKERIGLCVFILLQGESGPRGYTTNTNVHTCMKKTKAICARITESRYWDYDIQGCTYLPDSTYIMVWDISFICVVTLKISNVLHTYDSKSQPRGLKLSDLNTMYYGLWRRVCDRCRPSIEMNGNYWFVANNSWGTRYTNYEYMSHLNCCKSKWGQQCPCSYSIYS